MRQNTSKIFYMLLSNEIGSQNAGAPGGFAPWTPPPPRCCSGPAGDLDPSLILHPPNSKVESTPGFDTGAQSYPQLDACRKRRLNGTVLWMRPGKPRPRVTAGVVRWRSLSAQRPWAPSIGLILPPPPSHDIGIIWKFGWGGFTSCAEKKM
jgi:hypothetical protein